MPSSPMSARPFAAVAAVGVLVAFIVGASWWTVGRMQDDLTRRSRAALDAAGIDIAVEYSGRDATLAGATADAAQVEAAIAIVAGVGGTREVTSQVDVAAASPSEAAGQPSAPSSLTVTRVSGATEVRALVGPDDAAALERVLSEHAGDPTAALGIEVSEGVAPASWLPILAPLLSELGAVPDWRIELSSDGTAAVTVTVGEEEAADETRAALASILDGSPADATIAVVTAALPDGTITFDSGRAELSEEATASLDAVATYLKENPGVQLIIEGHTDDVGSDEFNRVLSRRRAGAVATYLSSQDVDAARLSTDGFADTRPVASNDTAAGRAANRRVELVIEGER